MNSKKYYAVTVNEDGINETHRYVDEARLLDGLITFGGLHVRGIDIRCPIVSYKEESFPSQDSITCDGRFGCE
jgi:hypothetical protein